jgi:hypothetical protein
MTNQRNHQGFERNTPFRSTGATQPGDPGAASSKLANTSPRAAPGTYMEEFNRRVELVKQILERG